MSYQMDMFGAAVPAHDDAMSLEAKAALLLDGNPESRSDDRLLMLAWWRQFDGLRDLFRWTLRDLFQGEMGQEELDAAADALLERFSAWFRQTATSPETIRRRRQELQRNRDQHGLLRGTSTVTTYRRARDGAGPPRRR